MTGLKLGPLADDKPVRLTVELPATVHRDLVAYAGILSQTSGKPAPEPAKLIAPMIERFMATDRAFVKARARAGYRGRSRFDRKTGIVSFEPHSWLISALSDA